MSEQDEKVPRVVSCKELDGQRVQEWAGRVEMKCCCVRSVDVSMRWETQEGSDGSYAEKLLGKKRTRRRRMAKLTSSGRRQKQRAPM